jgi:hypothetical protein
MGGGSGSGGLPAPQPPKPSSPSNPPTVPAAPVPDYPGLARKLAKLLQSGKRSDVLVELFKLGTDQRRALEAVLVPTLARGSLLQWGIELRRVLRLLARGQPDRPKVDSFTLSGGTSVKLTKSDLTKSTKVIAKTGVKMSLGGGTNVAYSLTYSGADASDVRWLQMIWRDGVLNFPASGKDPARSVPVQRRFDHLGRVDMPYYLSTHEKRASDPEKCRWHADSPSSKTPFYDTAVKRLTNELTMADDPSPTLHDDVALAYLKATPAPESVVSNFHAETYLVRGLDVLYRVKVDIIWKSTSAAPTPAGTISITGEPATELRAAQRARLAIQNPEVDYLPGPLIGPPLWSDDLEPIKDLKPGEWAGLKLDAEKLVAVADRDVANVGMVPYATATNAADRVVANPSAHVGLNYDGTLKPDGETGYIDPAGKYHNPLMPLSRTDNLPTVAMIVGKLAFHFGSTDFPKEAVVGTLRHEMQHGLQATYAIGWLVKWRDDFTDLDFGAWLSQQKMSTPDRLIVESGVTADLDVIEALAWTEGFIAAIPFLPPAVDVNLLKAKEKWPAALNEMRGAGDRYLALNTGDKKTAMPVTLARVRRYLCGNATQAQRDALIAWLKACLDPGKIVPAPDASTLDLIKGFFTNTQSQWLNELLEIAKNPCTK